MNREQEYQVVLKLRSLYDKLLELRPQISEPQKIYCNSMTKFSVMENFLRNLRTNGFDLKDLPLGHDLGHIVRDCRNAMLLGYDENLKKIIHPLDLIASFFGGTKHDGGLILFEKKDLTEKIFGFTPVSRYQEKNNFIRHAEAGALLIKKYLNLFGFKLNNIDTEYLCSPHQLYDKF